MSSKIATPRKQEETSSTSPKSKAKAKAKSVTRPAPKGGDAPGRTTPRAKEGHTTPRAKEGSGPPRKARLDMGRASQARASLALPNPEPETSSTPRTNEKSGSIGAVTSRDGGELIRKDDPAVERAAKVAIEPSPPSRSSSSSEKAANNEVRTSLEASLETPSLAPESGDWRSPREEDIAGKPLQKRSVHMQEQVPEIPDIVRGAHADDDGEKDWSEFNGVVEKFNKVNERLVTNVQANDRASSSEARQQPRHTHHQLMLLQAEVQKLQVQAPMVDFQSLGERDRETQLAIARLQTDLESLKATVVSSKLASKTTSAIQPQEVAANVAFENTVTSEFVAPKASIPKFMEETSTFETFEVVPKEFIATNIEPARVPIVRDVVTDAATRIASRAEETELLAAQQDSAEDDYMGSLVANIGYRKDGRDEELQQLLNDVYDKICVCSERLKEQKAASKAAINGMESLACTLPDMSFGEADDSRRDTWEEIEWLRRALVGMHQHLMSAQERTRALEQQCQEYEAHVQQLGPQCEVLFSSGFDISQGALPFETSMVSRETTPAPDQIAWPEYEEVSGASLAPLLTVPPIVRPPLHSQPMQTMSSTATQELSPTNLHSPPRSANMIPVGMAMRYMPPMQDLDTSTSFAYEPYLNVSSTARRPPMVATTPPVPIDGLSVGASGFYGTGSPPMSVLTANVVSTGSTTEAYPSGFASVGVPSRPMTMMASTQYSGSASVGVPSRHIPSSSSRPPSVSPLRQQRPLSMGPPLTHVHQGAQLLPVGTSQASDLGFGSALFNLIDIKKDGVLDRWELKAAVKSGVLQAGSAALRHVAEKSSAPVTPRTPAPPISWQTAYPSTMQYFAPLQTGPARSVSREPIVM